MSEKRSWLNFWVPKREPEAPEEEQRDGVDRRQAQQTFDGPERRRGDRRGKSYGLKFTTQRPLAELERWLDDHCRGGHHLSIDDMSDDFDKKTVRITFARDQDRQAFRRQFGAPKD